MHWYVVEQYHRQLATLGGARERTATPLSCSEEEVDEDGDTSKTLSLINRKWLKEVSLKKVSMGSKKSSAHSSESPLPFLSIYERDGLVTLIQQMLKGELFPLDAPPTFTNPKELLRELEDQLQSSNTEKLCASRPTGVGVVPPLSPSCPRKPRSSGSPQKRRRKVDGDGSQEGTKVLKKDSQSPSTKRKRGVVKRKRRSLVVSLPTKYVIVAVENGGSRPDSYAGDVKESPLVASSDGPRDFAEIDPHNSETVPSDGLDKEEIEEKKLCVDESESEHLVKSESERRSPENVGVSIARPVPPSPLLSSPLTSTALNSQNCSPSLLGSPYASPSQSFTLALELDSPLPSSSTPPTVLLTHQSHTLNHAHPLEVKDTCVSRSRTTDVAEVEN